MISGIVTFLMSWTLASSTSEKVFILTHYSGDVYDLSCLLTVFNLGIVGPGGETIGGIISSVDMNGGRDRGRR